MHNNSLTLILAVSTIILYLNSFTTTTVAQNNSRVISSNPPLFNTPYKNVYPACLAYRLPNNPTLYCNLARQHAIVDAICHKSVTPTCKAEKVYSQYIAQAMSSIANAVIKEKMIGRSLGQNPSLGNNTG